MMQHKDLPGFFQSLLPGDFASAGDLMKQNWIPQGLNPDTNLRLGIGDTFRMMPLRLESGLPKYAGNCVTLFFVCYGDLTVEFDNGCVTCHRDHALLVPEGVSYSVPPTPAESTIIVMNIRKKLLEDQLGIRDMPTFLSCLSGVSAPILYDLEKEPRAKWYLSEMLCEHFDPDRRTYSMIPALLSLLLASMDRCIDATWDTRTGSNWLAVNEITRYIRTNYSHISLQSTAKRFNFSPNYLSFLLKQETGQGFQELKQAACIAQSARLLLETNQTVAQIAQAVGIRNITHFYNLFSQRYGVTPAQYRKMGTSALEAGSS